MAPKNLSNSIAATYKWLRLGIGLMALAFPLILWIGGHLVASLPLQGSMSAYYHAGNALVPGQGVMRNEFVGILFAVGTILFLFRGISRLEDLLLNLAGVMALGVALFPMAWPEKSGAPNSFFSTHGVCAVTFFFCIGFVCIFCASDTLDQLEKVKGETQKTRYRKSYRILGVLMVALPLGAMCLKLFAPWRDWTIFFVEVAGIYVFSAFWLLKTYEISQTDLDKKVAQGKIRVEPRPMLERLTLHPLNIVSVDDSKL